MNNFPSNIKWNKELYNEFINNNIKINDIKIIEPESFWAIENYKIQQEDWYDDVLKLNASKYIDENKEYNFLNDILKNLRKLDLIVDDLTKNGIKKFMGICKVKPYNIARHIDILFVDYNSYYSSILYFTGSKNFNVYLRQKLLQKNMSLNEYCLKDLENNNIIYLTSEKEIFKIADIKYLEPHERNAEKYE